MSSKGIFEIAKKYAIDRTILELETILQEGNKDLSISIKQRLEELYKL